MEKPIYSFPVFNHSTDWVLVWGACTIILMLILAFSVSKYARLDVNRRNIVVMICFFIGLIAFGTSVFRLVSIWKLKPVLIFNNRIETPYGTASFTNIRDFYVKIEKHYKPMDPTQVRDSARYFFLLEKNDKTHVLSEGDYPVDSILAKLNDAMGY